MKAPEKFQLSMKINATINEFIFRIVFEATLVVNSKLLAGH